MNKLCKVFMTLFFMGSSYFSVANPTDGYDPVNPRCAFKPGKVCCISDNGQEICVPYNE